MIRRCAGAALLCAAVASTPGVNNARAHQDDAGLSAILDLAAGYVATYVKAFASTVSEERYEQAVMRLVNRGSLVPERQRTRRVLVSDYLLLQVPGSKEWAPFRDVYSVDGVPVRDRSDRLMKILLAPDPTAIEQALRIRDESSRYNIGDVTRDINVPTFALQILRTEHRDGFTFTSRGRERVGAADAVVVEYAEAARPTLIRGGEYEDVPAHGRFWLQPATGAVLRSVMETRPAGMRTRIEVAYRLEAKLEILVPAEMVEHHNLIEQTVDGRATYSKFRRFRVDTDFEIKIK